MPKPIVTSLVGFMEKVAVAVYGLTVAYWQTSHDFMIGIDPLPIINYVYTVIDIGENEDGSKNTSTLVGTITGNSIEIYVIKDSKLFLQFMGEVFDHEGQKLIRNAMIAGALVPDHTSIRHALCRAFGRIRTKSTQVNIPENISEFIEACQ